MKIIKEYPNYRVDESGNVFSIKSKKMLKHHTRRDGYKYVALYHNGKGFKNAIHRLVASAYCLRIDYNRNTVNHIDGNKNNNHYSNLEWCSLKENIRHAWKTGLYHTGENHHSAKIKNLDIEKIKQLYREGIKQQEIANRYGIGQDHVSRIINNKRRNRG